MEYICIFFLIMLLMVLGRNSFNVISNTNHNNHCIGDGNHIEPCNMCDFCQCLDNKEEEE